MPVAVPIAMVAAAGISAVASNSASKKSAQAAKDAANIQAQSASDANSEARRQFDLSRSDFEQSRLTGNKALSKLGYLSGDSSQPSYNWQTDPGYEFRQGEGEKAINRAAAARGGFNNGGTLKDLSRFNSNLASQEYGNAWNRLSSLAGIGQSANSQLSQLGQNYSQQYGNNVTGAGNAAASGVVGAANARSSGYQGVASALSGGIQNYQNQQMLKTLTTNNNNYPVQSSGSLGAGYTQPYDYGSTGNWST